MLDALLDTPGTELNGLAQHNILEIVTSLLDSPDELHFGVKKIVKKIIDRLPGIKARVLDKSFAKQAHCETISECKRIPQLFDGKLPKVLETYILDFIKLNSQNLKELSYEQLLRLCEAITVLPQADLLEKEVKQKLTQHLLENQEEITKNFVKHGKLMLACQLVEVVELLGAQNEDLCAFSQKLRTAYIELLNKIAETEAKGLVLQECLRSSMQINFTDEQQNQISGILSKALEDMSS